MTSSRRAAAALVAAALALVPASGPAVADAFLRMSDGKELRGTDVRKEGDLYLLELEGGSVITVPAALVVQVGLAGDTAPAEPLQPEGPQGEPAVAEKVTGLAYPQPQVLAGVHVAPPQTADQLAALGKPAEFQRDLVIARQGPSYWVPDPEEGNWAPSTWAKGPIDPEWKPTPAYDPNKDALANSKSTFTKSIVDSSWTPKDGFAK